MNVHRRLAALLFADIVDFSGLSARDEAAALRLVPVFQAATREVVARYGGRIVKFLGDGVLAEFPTSGNAIGAAVALLERLAPDAERAGLARAELRIGVHAGDVAISEDGDVYGDGVNVTARLCEEAVPGSILVSEDVQRQLKQRPQFEFSPRADRELQGVGRVGTFEVRVTSPVEPDLEATVPGPGGRHASLRGRQARVVAGAALVVLALAAWATRGSWTSWIGAESAESATLDPSRLAVLYFRDQSETRDLEHLADGFTETLIHELAGVEGLKVVSQYGVRPFDGSDFPIDSVARMLEAGTIIDGSVSRSGDSLRVQVRLLDATDMTQIASITEVRPWSEMFTLQDEITAEVSTALRRRLGEEFDLQRRRRATESVEAWELVQRAERMDQQAQRAGEDLGVAAAMRSDADSLLARAGALDPRWAEPWIARGRMTLRSGNELALTRGLEHVDVALRRDPGNAAALTVRGALRDTLARRAADSTRAAGLLVAAERDLRTAVAADPSYARGWITLADLLYNDKWELSEARESARRAYEADVFLLEEGHFIWLCEISIQLEDHEEARKWCAQGLERFPSRTYLLMTDLVRLTSPGAPADPAAGWARVREVGRQPYPEFNVPAAKMYLAAILARAGDRDSANAVVLDARRTVQEQDRASLEPSLDYIEAYIRVLLRDERSALRLLRTSLTGYPPYRATAAQDYWFERLAGDPRFEALVDRVHLPIFCRILCRPPE